MRRFVWLTLFVCGLFSLATLRAGETDKTFFNGKDLTGWEGLLEYWTVKDGAIIGSTAPDGLKFNTFLCSKEKYKDFELHFEVRLTGKNANSGVQIRSKIVDEKTFQNAGPQCDMGQQYWGSLYGEHFGGMMKAADSKLVKEILKENDWNDYYIKCVGKRVTIKLNGKTTVDDEFPKMPDEGIISWQLHSGPAMEAAFRNIRFKNLTNDKK